MKYIGEFDLDGKRCGYGVEVSACAPYHTIAGTFYDDKVHGICKWQKASNLRLQVQIMATVAVMALSRHTLASSSANDKKFFLIMLIKKESICSCPTGKSDPQETGHHLAIYFRGLKSILGRR